MNRALILLAAALLATPLAAQSNPMGGAGAQVSAPTAAVAGTKVSGAERERQKAVRDAERDYKPKVTRDAFEKGTVTDLPLDALVFTDLVKCNNSTHYSDISLVARDVRADGIAPQAILALVYNNSEDWLFIDDAGPLQFLADTALVELRPFGNPSRDVARSGVQEVAYYALGLPAIERLTSADSVRVRVSGEKGHCDFPLRPKARELLRLFAVRQLGDSTLAP